MVELMIALVLGLVIVAAMGQLYSGTRQTSRVSEALAELNESGRFAVDFLSADLRVAGYLSCAAAVLSRSAFLRSTVDSANAATGEEWLYELRSDPLVDEQRDPLFGAIRGFDDDIPESVEGLEDRLEGTDVVLIRRALPNPDRPIEVLQEADAETLDLTPSGHGFQPGEILVVSSPGCDQTSIFQVTAATDDSVIHSDDSAVVPGNCISTLVNDADCEMLPANVTGEIPEKESKKIPVKPRSSVTRYSVQAYYVRDADPPVLTRIRLTYPGDPAAEAGKPYVKENLIRGVENFQILYGIKTGKDDSPIVDEYKTADEIDADANIAWRDVLSARFALLIRSREPNVRTDETGQSYDLLGMLDEPFEPSDRYLRKTFGGVVALRNMIR